MQYVLACMGCLPPPSTHMCTSPPALLLLGCRVRVENVLLENARYHHAVQHILVSISELCSGASTSSRHFCQLMATAAAAVAAATAAAAAAHAATEAFFLLPIWMAGPQVGPPGLHIPGHTPGPGHSGLHVSTCATPFRCAARAGRVGWLWPAVWLAVAVPAALPVVNIPSNHAWWQRC